MNNLTPVLTITSAYTVCGGVIKVVGYKEGIFQIGEIVKVKSDTNSFYASVISFDFKSDTIELILENFGNNTIEIGMVIYQA